VTMGWGTILVSSKSPPIPTSRMVASTLSKQFEVKGLFERVSTAYFEGHEHVKCHDS
jgi:hypothetical protein